MKKYKIKLLNYLMSSIAIIGLLACGGNTNSDSTDCNINTKDSDKDGIFDEYDFLPNESFENGKYNNLENVVNAEGVKHILKIAKERGVTVNLQLSNNPPKLNGYYKSEDGGRVVYARNSDRRGSSGYIAATESRICNNNKYMHTANNSSFGSFVTNSKIKGDGKYFSEYFLQSYKHATGCKAYYADIRSGKVDSKSGDIKNYKVIIAPLGYEEKTVGACTPYRGSNRSEEVFTTEDMKKITDLDELEYMCVDEGKAYIPTETWKNKDKEICKCTTDIEIECE